MDRMDRQFDGDNGTDTDRAVRRADSTVFMITVAWMDTVRYDGTDRFMDMMVRRMTVRIDSSVQSVQSVHHAR